MRLKLGKLNLGDGDTLDLDHYLSEDYDDISVASEEIPPVLEWLNDRLQQVYESKLDAKNKLKRAEAQAYFDLKRGDFKDTYPGSMTEKSLEHAVQLSKKVQQAQNDYVLYSGWVNRLRGLQGSFSSKLDLIRSTESTRRRLFTGKDPDEHDEEED